MVGPQPRKTSSLKPQGPSAVATTSSRSPYVAAQPEGSQPQGDTPILDHKGVLLPHPMKNQDADSANSDTRIAMEKDEEEGLAIDENVDMYLNLQNIRGCGDVNGFFKKKET